MVLYLFNVYIGKNSVDRTFISSALIEADNYEDAIDVYLHNDSFETKRAVYVILTHVLYASHKYKLQYILKEKTEFDVYDYLNPGCCVDDDVYKQFVSDNILALRNSIIDMHRSKTTHFEIKEMSIESYHITKSASKTD